MAVRDLAGSSPARHGLRAAPPWALLLRRRELLVSAVIVVVVAASTAAQLPAAKQESPVGQSPADFRGGSR